MEDSLLYLGSGFSRKKMHKREPGYVFISDVTNLGNKLFRFLGFFNTHIGIKDHINLTFALKQFATMITN
jgi:hypothetical protein